MKSIGTGWHVKESQLNQPEFKHFAIRHYNAEYFRVQRELQALQSKIRGLLECASARRAPTNWSTGKIRDQGRRKPSLPFFVRRKLGPPPTPGPGA